jgi:hypothetical protein
MGLALRQRQRQEPWAAFKACVLRIACMYGSVSQKEKEREQEGEWEVAVRGHTCEYIDDQAGRRGVVINTYMDRHFWHEGSLGRLRISALSRSARRSM